MKTSQKWLAEIQERFPKVNVLDPDGWDRKNYEYSFNQELISKEEFKKRFYMSTVMLSSDYIEYIKAVD
jgi:hypothetical protein